MLHSRLLRYLDEVARSGSMRKAAERLNVASSAINRQVLALEQQLGVPLFDRLPHRLVPTPAGEVMIAHVRDTMRAMGRAQAQIDDMRGLKGGEISIGIISGLAATLIPLAITQFRTLHPRVKVKVTVATGKEILSQVAEENLDLGLGFNLSRKSRVRLLFSVPSRLGAVVGKKHPLFGRRSIRLTDCIGYPICIADSTMAIHTILSEIFDRSSASITPAVETNSVEIMRRMAADGECITFLSQFETLFDKRSSESLGYIPIIGPQLVDETLMLVGRARNANMHSLRFAEVIKGVMSEISVSADR